MAEKSELEQLREEVKFLRFQAATELAALREFYDTWVYEGDPERIAAASKRVAKLREEQCSR